MEILNINQGDLAASFANTSVHIPENPIYTTRMHDFIHQLCEIYRVNTCFDVVREQIMVLLKDLTLSDEDIRPFETWKPEKRYTRNLIATDDRNFTILLLCWNEGAESCVHDHANVNGCFVKGLRGSGCETRFTWEEDSKELRNEIATVFTAGDVSFMHDNYGVHKISNCSSTERLTTLHIYTPPYQKCGVYVSGQPKSSCSACYDSVVGKATA